MRHLQLPVAACRAAVAAADRAPVTSARLVTAVGGGETCWCRYYTYDIHKIVY